MLTRTAALTLLGSVCVISACSDAPAPPPPPPAAAPAPATPATSAAATAAPGMPAPFTFVPIAGAWTPTIDDGQPTMTADGTKPSSGSPHPLIGQLFGADAETFENGPVLEHEKGGRARLRPAIRGAPGGVFILQHRHDLFKSQANGPRLSKPPWAAFELLL